MLSPQAMQWLSHQLLALSLTFFLGQCFEKMGLAALDVSQCIVTGLRRDSVGDGGERRGGSRRMRVRHEVVSDGSVRPRGVKARTVLPR